MVTRGCIRPFSNVAPYVSKQQRGYLIANSTEPAQPFVCLLQTPSSEIFYQISFATLPQLLKDFAYWFFSKLFIRFVSPFLCIPRSELLESLPNTVGKGGAYDISLLLVRLNNCDSMV